MANDLCANEACGGTNGNSTTRAEARIQHNSYVNYTKDYDYTFESGDEADDELAQSEFRKWLLQLPPLERLLGCMVLRFWFCWPVSIEAYSLDFIGNLS